MLSQVDDNSHEKVITYYGRRLIPAERNYSVTEMELLAALESIRNWRPYLWGRKFRLVINHSALRWLHTMKDTVEGGPASRLMRWALKLAEYRFTIEHTPGAFHENADGISRLVVSIDLNRGTYIAAVQSLNPNSFEFESSRKARTRTTTARSLQAAERATRRDSTTHSSILLDYLHSNAQSHQTIAEAQQLDPITRKIIGPPVYQCGEHWSGGPSSLVRGAREKLSIPPIGCPCAKFCSQNLCAKSCAQSRIKRVNLSGLTLSSFTRKYLCYLRNRFY